MEKTLDDNLPIFGIEVFGNQVKLNASNKHRRPTHGHEWQGAISNPIVPANEWYFLAVRLKDGKVGDGTLDIWINETRVTRQLQMTDRDLPSIVEIGTLLSGAIDELVVFEQAISDERIAALYRPG